MLIKFSCSKIRLVETVLYVNRALTSVQQHDWLLCFPSSGRQLASWGMGWDVCHVTSVLW